MALSSHKALWLLVVLPCKVAVLAGSQTLLHASSLLRWQSCRQPPLQATVRAVLATSGYVDSTQEAGEGPVGLVLDQTSFYADGGGQATDVGLIVGSSGSLDVEHVEVRLHWNLWCLWQQVLKNDVGQLHAGTQWGTPLI